MGGKNKNAAEESGKAAGGLGSGSVPGSKSGVKQCPKPHWIGVRVEDEDGATVRDIEVSFELTDGSDFTINLASQTLEPDGTYRTETNLPPGNCKFGMPETQDVEWWPKGEQPAKVPADKDDDGGNGACAVSIADDRDFRNYHSFWDDAKNQPLRDKKRNPNQLSSKDTVFYSKRKKKTVDKAVDKVWTLVVKKKRPVKLRIVLFDRDGKPVSSASWKMTSPVNTTGKTGADGLIEINNFPPQKESGEITVTLPARAKVGPTPANPAAAPLDYPPALVYTQFINPAPEEPPDRTKAEWHLKIGHLEPFDTKQGVLGRLGNIGFHCDPDSGKDETAWAVKAYQRSHLNNKKGSGNPSDIQNDLLARHDNP